MALASRVSPFYIVPDPIISTAHPMKNSIVLWTVAFLITAASAVYQRMTGPTYPVTERITLNGADLSLRLERSHSTGSDFRVEVPTQDPDVSGSVVWKRRGTDDAWSAAPLVRGDSSLGAELPRQPAAGKLLYHLELRDRVRAVRVPADGAVTVRFKGDVPLAVLLFHVIGIFGAMLLSTRTAFEAFAARPNYRAYALVTVGLLFFGGLVLGPIVQKYAFDAYWTGWPLGHDLTDNKTAVAFLAWLITLRYLDRTSHPVRWVVGAALVTLAVFIIPHSLLGSEFDYSQTGARP